MILEKGMTIYEDNKFNGLSQYTIDRVTKTQAIINSGNRNERRFNRDIDDNFGFRSKGHNTGWDAPIYRIETPELLEKYTRQTLVYRIKKFDFNVLDTETLINVYNIVKEKELNNDQL